VPTTTPWEKEEIKNMNSVKAEATDGSNAKTTTIADLGWVRNAADANEAFEVIWSWGWSYPEDTRRIVLAKNLREAVKYVLHDIEADPESDESNSITARMIQSADVEKTYAGIKNADDVVDARNW
jgi:hypothetical protein